MSATTEPPIRLDDSPEGNPRWRVLVGTLPSMIATHVPLPDAPDRWVIAWESGPAWPPPNRGMQASALRILDHHIPL